MVSFLDTGLVLQAQTIFVFVLMWALIYGMLSYTKLFNLEKNLQSIIAVILALFTIMFPPIRGAIAAAIPWFSIVIITIVFMLMMIMMFGLTDKDLKKAMDDSKMGQPIKIIIIIISLVIIISALGSVFFTQTQQAEAQVTQSINSPDPTQVGTTGSSALISTLFHPKVLGLIVLMLIAFFAVQLLSR